MRSPEDQRQIAARLLSAVRSGRADSRRALAEVLRLSPTTAGQYVDDLIARGYLHEAGLDRGAPGRPKRTLTTLGGAGWFAGLEFNAERIQAVRVDFSGRVITSCTRPLPTAIRPREVLDELAAAIATLRQQAAGPLLAAGLGAPGIVDPQRGLALFYAFLPEWQNVPVAVELRAGLQVPVSIENNLRVIALAEKWFGGGRDLEDYVILGPRRGFGLAIVKNGRLVGGAHHAAGEIGLWPWTSAGSAAGASLHDALAAPAVWRRLSGAGPRTRLPQDLHAALAACAENRGPARTAVIADYARALGQIQLLLDAEVYFLHGPQTALGPRFGEEIARAAHRLIPALREQPLRIIPSTLDDQAGALGAASMAMESWLPELD